MMEKTFKTQQAAQADMNKDMLENVERLKELILAGRVAGLQTIVLYDHVPGEGVEAITHTRCEAGCVTRCMVDQLLGAAKDLQEPAAPRCERAH
jgi:hypothetical protein